MQAGLLRPLLLNAYNIKISIIFFKSLFNKSFKNNTITYSQLHYKCVQEKGKWQDGRFIEKRY